MPNTEVPEWTSASGTFGHVRLEMMALESGGWIPAEEEV